MPYTNKMKTLFPVLAIFLILTSIGCSDKTRARRLVRVGYHKIQKALILDPTLADTVKGKKDVKILVPGDSIGLTIRQEFDSSSFHMALRLYDSAMRLSDSLAREVKKHKEISADARARMAESANALASARRGLMKCFYKDSTYHHEDSVLVIDVIVKDGHLQSVGARAKPREVHTTVNTQSINLKTVEAAFKQIWFWILIAIILGLALFVVILAKKRL